MANKDAYGNPIGPTTGTTIAKEWGDAVAATVVPSYPDTTARDAVELSPPEGRTIFLEDSDTHQVYNGSTWVTLPTVTSVQAQIDAENANQAQLVRVYRNTALTIATTTLTVCGFDAENVDDWAGHSTSVNPARIADDGEGLYHAELQVTFDTNATGYRQCEIWHGSGLRTAMDRKSAISGDSTIVRCSTVLYLDGTEYVEARVYQDSGGNLDVLDGNAVSWFALSKLAVL